MNFQVIMEKVKIAVMNFSDTDVLSFKNIHSSFCQTVGMMAE